MGSLRNILGRTGERDNLVTVLFCVFLVLLITLIGFGVANIDYSFHSVQDSTSTGTPQGGNGP